jgi:hypothetical protein
MLWVGWRDIVGGKQIHESCRRSERGDDHALTLNENTYDNGGQMSIHSCALCDTAMGGGNSQLNVIVSLSM